MSEKARPFVHHVLVGESARNQTLLDVVDRKLVENNTTKYTAQELLDLQSIWYMEASKLDLEGAKPQRAECDIPVHTSDYLRIHHSPRRYETDSHSWKRKDTDSVIVHDGRRRGYLVIDKPAGIPVHKTVDNGVENVAHALERANRNTTIWTPQRLDQNTSGLLVLGTTKAFATYFATLLSNKTALALNGDSPQESIHKTYRCLVCLDDFDRQSLLEEWVQNQTIIRHYLQPSMRAPKRYLDEPQGENWAESLMRIVKVGKFHCLQQHLKKQLWPSENQPETCVGVTELEIELVTGRTHQIRGQLAALNLPIVGDVQYGGAIPLDNPGKMQYAYYYFDSEKLALQCCELSFIDPDRQDRNTLKRSDRWNRFQLDTSWWRPILNPARPELLPKRVSLSPGVHKYVLVKATHPAGETEWFVKSASPSECGGAYHGHVAQDLREWIQAAGYGVEVTGGGRIDYRDDRVIVFGQSNAFGKADHSLAAQIISRWSNGEIETFCHNVEDFL